MVLGPDPLPYLPFRPRQQRGTPCVGSARLGGGTRRVLGRAGSDFSEGYGYPPCGSGHSAGGNRFHRCALSPAHPVIFMIACWRKSGWRALTYAELGGARAFGCSTGNSVKSIPHTLVRKVLACRRCSTVLSCTILRATPRCLSTLGRSIAPGGARWSGTGEVHPVGSIHPPPSSPRANGDREAASQSFALVYRDSRATAYPGIVVGPEAYRPD